MLDDYDNEINELNRFIISARKETDYELDEVENMDEVSLAFNVISYRIQGVKGHKDVNVNTSEHQKTYYFSVLPCYADGTKLTPLLIYKRTVPKHIISRGMFVNRHRKGRLDEEGVIIR